LELHSATCGQLMNYNDSQPGGRGTKEHATSLNLELNTEAQTSRENELCGAEKLIVAQPVKKLRAYYNRHVIVDSCEHGNEPLSSIILDSTIGPCVDPDKSSPHPQVPLPQYISDLLIRLPSGLFT
jgi:hypothetical protein